MLRAYEAARNGASRFIFFPRHSPTSRRPRKVLYVLVNCRPQAACPSRRLLQRTRVKISARDWRHAKPPLEDRLFSDRHLRYRVLRTVANLHACVQQMTPYCYDPRGL